MEIRIILDDRIVNGARRVFSRTGLAALTAVALLAGGAALVAQEANEASNVFSPGEVISSGAPAKKPRGIPSSPNASSKSSVLELGTQKPSIQRWPRRRKKNEKKRPSA